MLAFGTSSDFPLCYPTLRSGRHFVQLIFVIGSLWFLQHQKTFWMFLVYCCWCGKFAWTALTILTGKKIGSHWYFSWQTARKVSYWLFLQLHSYSTLKEEWSKKSPLNSAFCCLQNHPEVRCWEQSEFHICCRVHCGAQPPRAHPV